jgi:hypothetical protein
MTGKGTAHRYGTPTKLWRFLQWPVAAVTIVATILTFLPARAFGAGSQGTVTAPTAPAGPYTDGQQITVSGTGFSTNSGDTITIVECADAGGTAGNLPTDNSTCDLNTGNPLGIRHDASGGFSSPYTVALDQVSSGGTIDCDATHYCVLWIGEDFNGNFTGSSAQPVAFSPPFLINPSGGGGGTTTTTVPPGSTTGGGPAPSGGTSGPIPTGSTTPSATSASSTDTGGTSPTTADTTGGSTGASTAADTSSSAPELAMTGPPRLLPGMVALGGGLVLIGGVARRRLRVTRR